jgi:hypothetical protein
MNYKDHIQFSLPNTLPNKTKHLTKQKEVYKWNKESS